MATHSYSSYQLIIVAGAAGVVAGAFGAATAGSVAVEVAWPR